MGASMVALVVLLSISSIHTEDWAWGGRPVHFAVYAGLSMWLLNTAVWAPVRGRGRFPQAAPVVLLLLVVLGVAGEIAQFAVPTRTPDPLDALADAAGIILGFLAWVAMRRSARAIASRSH